MKKKGLLFIARDLPALITQLSEPFCACMIRTPVYYRVNVRLGASGLQTSQESGVDLLQQVLKLKPSEAPGGG